MVRRFNQAEKQIDKCIKAGMSFTDVHNRMGDAFIEYARGDYAEGHFSAAYKSAVFDGGITFHLSFLNYFVFNSIKKQTMLEKRVHCWV